MKKTLEKSKELVPASSFDFFNRKSSLLSPYRKKSCDFFRGLRIFLCKSFKRYRSIIRTDCDYRKQSTPSGVGAPPLFNGEKAKTLLGRGDALRPRPTFETRKALIRLTKSKIWSLIEKVGKSLLRGSVPHVAISCVIRSTIRD